MGSTSVVSNLVNELRRDISLGTLEPGQKLRIEVIRSTYGVSAPSVREALSVLTGERFVTAVDQRGFSVANVSVQELTDLTRVRAELEKLALGWSIENSTREWRSAVVAKHHILTEVEGEFSTSIETSIMDWDEANRDFHLALSMNCSSESLIDLIKSQYDLTRRYRLMAYGRIASSRQKADWLQRSIVEHAAIKDAVLQSDTRAATDVLGAHITKAQAGGQAS